MNKTKCISFSIVSHNQADIVAYLLADLRILQNQNNTVEFEVIITLNTIQESMEIPPKNNLNIKIIQNREELGFSNNHNNAFKISKGDYFVVVNPDVRINKYFNKIQNFLKTLDSLDINIGVISPIEIDFKGEKRENYRKFPTLFNLISRRYAQKFHKKNISTTEKIFYVDWITGMFMCFRSNIYSELNGFDSRYFLYCEDIDICRRINQKGLKVAVWNEACIQHEGQYASRKKIKYTAIHIISMAKYFMKYK